MSESTKAGAQRTLEESEPLDDGADQYVSPDVRDDDDVVWVPPEQPAKRGFFGMHEGELVLLAKCDDCGATTRTTPEQHLFVPCANAPCNGEITLEWDEPA